MKQYPALDVRADDVELLYAALDDFSPTAVEEGDDGVRAFFLTSTDRDAALQSLASRYVASAVDVPDEDWARRSQAHLGPITVGTLTIQATATGPASRSGHHLVIAPSMGFGTGHHATTRLCLAALQTIDLGGKRVLDVGTGSGVLAIAARALGSTAAHGIDNDPDAVQAARENLALNPSISDVTFDVADLTLFLVTKCLGSDPVVTANLTGALLVRSAAALLNATADGGVLTLSGFMRHERDDVVRAFAPARVAWEQAEDEWVGLVMKKS